MDLVFNILVALAVMVVMQRSGGGSIGVKRALQFVFVPSVVGITALVLVNDHGYPSVILVIPILGLLPAFFSRLNARDLKAIRASMLLPEGFNEDLKKLDATLTRNAPWEEPPVKYTGYAAVWEGKLHILLTKPGVNGPFVVPDDGARVIEVRKDAGVFTLSFTIGDRL